MPRTRAPRSPDRFDLIGYRLKAARLALGLTQVEICQAIGVGVSTWNHWEHGRRRPDPIALARFANRYDIGLDWPYRGELRHLPFHLADKLRDLIGPDGNNPLP